MMLADYHLHLENGPLTREYLEDFLRVGRERGLAELGFSEHIYNFTDTLSLWPAAWQVEPQGQLAAYIKLITTAKEAGLPVKLGLEVDYLEGKEEELAAFLDRYPWDYVIGSIHHLGDWGFDHPDYRSQWESTDVGMAYREYFRLFSKAARSGLFEIMAHPDVIKVFGYRPAEAIDDLWEEAAAAMAAGRVAVEISTAGLRKPVGEIYPHPGFLRRCKDYNIPIVISSDAHYPEDVGKDFPRAVSLARQAGYDKICLFTARKRSLVPLSD
jgi:histidinol-phosphatase (PHP family)